MPSFEKWVKVMTIEHAIAQCDQRRPNQYTKEDKIEWLAELDSRVFQDVLAIHEGDLPDYEPYVKDTPVDTEMLVAVPYERIYPLWLFAMVDYHNNDLQRYNASAAMFEQVYGEYRAWYNRMHMPLQPTRITYEAKGKVIDYDNPLR